ncbi:hypothetical protein M3484_18175 [Pseudomonas sp. GX19020]|uniref:hypothetical protein n=1 Tax=Pseudomonadota TaxID=1224 RepID=UPI00089978A1|nr:MULTISPECIES: hypothetical protein [Pseudomonadota]MCL4068495.1 hypothetical protein [Pseudomonas sp. GX19020]SEB44136.1 hypothetical protein SAMN05519105_0297 [Rhodobacter sp. 24-YEA-8]
MKKVMTAAVALSLVGSAAFAGGPVVVIDDVEPVVVTERTSSTGGVLVPLLIGAAVLCAVACGSDS